MKPRQLLIFIAVFCVIQTKAQNISEESAQVLAKAQEMVQQKKLQEAYNLLGGFNSRLRNADAFQLQAQVAYWLSYFSQADSLYTIAIQEFPASTVITMDYARFLWNTGQFNKAYPLLEQSSSLPDYLAEAVLYLGYIDQWNHRLPLARRRADSLLAKYPDYAEALALRQEINAVSAPYISSGIIYTNDDQPYQTTRFQVESGLHHSGLLSPYVSAEWAGLQPPGGNNNTVALWAGNTFRAGMNGPSLMVAGGYIQHNTAQDANAMLYKVRATQKISKRLSIAAQLAKIPYQYTISSAPLLLTPQQFEAALSLNHKDKWQGKAAWENTKFQDGNKVRTGYVWLLAPVVAQKNFLLQAGYSFTMANSDSNRFVPDKIPTATLQGQSLPGIYNPYFTPLNQQIQSVLLAGKAVIGKGVTFYWNGSYGIKAVNETAWYYLQLINNSPVLLSGIVPVDYTPVEFRFALGLTPGKGWSVTPAYQYSKLFFFTAHQVSASLKYSFIKN